MVKMPKETGGQTVGAALPIAELTDEGHALAVEYYNYRLAEAEALMKDYTYFLRRLADLLKERKTVYYEEVMECIGRVWDSHALRPFIKQEETG
jgi:hypothetical protein